MECIRVRTEMEEAAKMDAARLASEQEGRKLEAQRRRASVALERKETILHTPLLEWDGHYPHSWILKKVFLHNDKKDVTADIVAGAVGEQRNDRSNNNNNNSDNKKESKRSVNIANSNNSNNSNNNNNGDGDKMTKKQ